MSSFNDYVKQYSNKKEYYIINLELTKKIKDDNIELSGEKEGGGRMGRKTGTLLETIAKLITAIAMLISSIAAIITALK